MLTVRRAFISGLLFFALIPAGALSGETVSIPIPLYVDSKAIKDRFDSLTAEDMEKLRRKKILLASRSFGLNTCNGFAALAKKDKKYDFLSSYKRFDVFKAGGNTGIIPPDIFSKVNFVHSLATHWPPTKRVDEVEQLLRSEPHNFGKVVDAVIIYYDLGFPEAFDYYAKKMDALQADFPKVRFIYITGGFMGKSKPNENEKSHLFSEKVRERYLGKVPLYDMGKILSDDFRCGHNFCPEYSKDPADVHPNLATGETMLAKGLLLVLHEAFATPDKTPHLEAVKAVKPALPNETLPAVHPDMQAVRAILDANGLTKKTVESVSVVEGGRIVALYLQEGGVTELPEAIGKLEALRLLHLYGDRKQPYPLLKKISPALANCKKLEELLLNQNDLEILPAEIAVLVNIKTLSLADNKLKKLPAEAEKWAKRFDPKGLLLQNLTEK